MDWIKIKEIIVKARYIIGGLVLASIPHELEQITFISGLESGTFQSGLASGLLLGIRIVGVCILAYGIAFYRKEVGNE